MMACVDRLDDHPPSSGSPRPFTNVQLDASDLPVDHPPPSDSPLLLMLRSPVAIDLARQMLQIYPSTYALVLSTENITQNW